MIQNSIQIDGGETRKDRGGVFTLEILVQGLLPEGGGLLLAAVPVVLFGTDVHRRRGRARPAGIVLQENVHVERRVRLERQLESSLICDGLALKHQKKPCEIYRRTAAFTPSHSETDRS